MCAKRRPKESSVAGVYIVDDHPIVCWGLSTLIDKEKDLKVDGCAHNYFEALNGINAVKPEIAVVDISLGDASGLELVRAIKAENHNMLVLVLSMHDESIYGNRAFRAGADGYLMKREASTKIISALRALREGKAYASSGLFTSIIHQMGIPNGDLDSPAVDSLSDRELEIFSLLGKGFGIKDIAERLYLSRKTVETHREHIKHKLDISTAGELTRYAIEWYQAGSASPA